HYFPTRRSSDLTSFLNKLFQSRFFKKNKLHPVAKITVRTIPIAEITLCVAPSDRVKPKVEAKVLLSRKYKIVSGSAPAIKIKTETLINGPIISCPIVRPL